MRACGLQREVILEQSATNTGENARFTYQILKERGISAESILVVTKPYMERRAKVTFEKQWLDKLASIRVTSPTYTFDNYCNDTQPIDDVINIMVGDLERIINYPRLGYQTEQHVPKKVIQALVLLKKAGFTKRTMTR